MRLTRVHVDQKLIAGKGVGLSEQAGLHLTRVLRLDVGAPLTLFDGPGGTQVPEPVARAVAVKGEAASPPPLTRLRLVRPRG